MSTQEFAEAGKSQSARYYELSDALDSLSGNTLKDALAEAAAEISAFADPRYDLFGGEPTAQRNLPNAYVKDLLAGRDQPRLALGGVLLVAGSEGLPGRTIAERIACNPYLENVSGLSLIGCRLGDEGVAALSRSVSLKGLRWIKLAYSDIGPAGAEALGSATNFPRLEALDLSDNPGLTDRGVEALLDGSIAVHLNILALSNCGLHERAGLLLARSGLLPRLRMLAAGHNAIGDQGVVNLCDGVAESALQVLSLHECGIGSSAAALSPLLKHVESLELSRNPIGPAGIRAVLQACSDSLISLSLHGCQLRTEGAEAIASLAPRSLEKLLLWDNAIGDRGAAALANSPHLTGLRTLHLVSNEIGDAGAEALRVSPFIRCLDDFDIARKPAISEQVGDALWNSEIRGPESDQETFRPLDWVYR